MGGVENLAVAYLPIGQLRVDARNARSHPKQQIAKLAALIREVGFTNPILLSEDGQLIAGHGRLEAARLAGLEVVPTICLKGLTEGQRRALVIADNRIAEGSGWDKNLLTLELHDIAKLVPDLGLTGFSAAELDKLIGGSKTPRESADDIPAVAPLAITSPGDVWVMGKHRLTCGDATSPEDTARLFAGATIDLICTDPPYCSGGFQESGKASGSVGTTATHKMVANDTLSTRGFSALLKSAFSQTGAPFIYAFTDWRMWVHLFDVAESSGFGVRSMIVWNKETPGMGRGWRTQHELILWGCKRTAPFDKHASGVGNVITEKRTGNKYHTTEKPVALVAQLIRNVPFVKSVADPFTGSGTTLIACEELGVPFYGHELDPLYVDVGVRRWQQYTGNKAVRERDGMEFDDAARTTTDTNKPPNHSGEPGQAAA